MITTNAFLQSEHDSSRATEEGRGHQLKLGLQGEMNATDPMPAERKDNR